MEFSNLSALWYSLTYKLILMMFVQYAQLLWLSLSLGQLLPPALYFDNFTVDTHTLHKTQFASVVSLLALKTSGGEWRYSSVSYLTSSLGESVH
jgi:hypothetical protein